MALLVRNNQRYSQEICLEVEAISEAARSRQTQDQGKTEFTTRQQPNIDVTKQQVTSR